MERDTENERNRRRNMRMHILLAVDAALLAAILLVSGLLLYRSHNRETEQHLSQVQAPDWYTQDFLTVNPYSRPGTKREHCGILSFIMWLTRAQARNRTGTILRA